MVEGVLSANTIKGINGNLAVSGSTTFDKIKVASGSAATVLTDTIVESSGSAGLVTLKAGKTFVKVLNPNVTVDSLIFTTPKGSSQGKNLYIKQQIDSDSFTVGIEGSTAAEDIDFNFLIVN